MRYELELLARQLGKAQVAAQYVASGSEEIVARVPGRITRELIEQRGCHIDRDGSPDGITKIDDSRDKLGIIVINDKVRAIEVVMEDLQSQAGNTLLQSRESLQASLQIGSL